MRSFTIITALALFERGLVMAGNYYNFYYSDLSGSHELKLWIELATLANEPSISVATFRVSGSFKYNAAEFWVDDVNKKIVVVPKPGKLESLQHAAFISDGSLPFSPIYFAAKPDKSELIVTKKEDGHTLGHPIGFKVNNSSKELSFKKVPWRRSKFAFCPCPLGDIRLISGLQPFKNKYGQPMVLSIMEEDSARDAGCVPAVIKAVTLEAGTGWSSSFSYIPL